MHLNSNHDAAMIDLAEFPAIDCLAAMLAEFAAMIDLAEMLLQSCERTYLAPLHLAALLPNPGLAAQLVLNLAAHCPIASTCAHTCCGKEQNRPTVL